MSELLILRGLLFAAECFLASLLLPVFAFAVSALLRRRAALRHLVFTTMFGVLAVLPLVALLLPPRRIVEHVAAPVAMSAADLMPMAAPSASLTLSLSDLLTAENIVLLLLALWLAGIAWQTLRLFVGGLGLLRLRRASIPFAVELETGCDVRLSDGEHGPSTFGIFRPIVLLPRSARAWPSARLDAVLRHEAAHVRRRDTLSQFIARLVCAVFWPNPLLWLAAREQRREAEIAADDAVLAGGLTPSLYADALVSLAAESRGVAPGVAMAGPPLAQRVEAVLAQNVSRKGVSRMDMAKTVSFGLAATLLLGVARFDIAVAQDTPAPAAPASPAAAAIGPAPADPAEAAPVRARIEAQAAAIKAKAKADAVTAKAKAKAAAETNPAKKAQDEQDAAQAAERSAQVKATADRVAADIRVNADRLKAQMDQIRPQLVAQAKAAAAQEAQMDQIRPQLAAQAKAAAAQVKVEMEKLRPQIAMMETEARANAARMRVDAAQPSGGAAESHSSQSQERSVTINGLTTADSIHVETGKPSNGLTIARPQANDPSRKGTRYFSIRDGVQIDIQVNPAVEEAMNRPELRNAIRDAVTAAMAEAGKKIDAAITEARAKAGLPFVPPVAPVPPMPAAPPASPAPG